MLLQNHPRKQNSGEFHYHLPFTNSDHCFFKYRKPSLLRLFLFFFLFSSTFIFVAVLHFPSYPPKLDQKQAAAQNRNESPCSSFPNNTICCDRTAFRTDICFMKGDVRTNSVTNSIFLVSSANSSSEEEKIKPYTRKWEKDTMDRIDELRLNVRGNETRPCDVRHDVPAVFFSTGGYTGNVYHEFNDGLIPLYITTNQFNKKVVYVILEYHDWWISKYENILSQLSDFAPIDFTNDKRTHCFPEATLGLKIHDELTIDSTRMTNNKTIRDFRQLLDESYKPRIQAILEEEGEMPGINKKPSKKPKLVLVSRNGSRRIENEAELVKLAEQMGFHVQVLRPTPTTELAKIYRALNSSDVMIGVHGAAMTHLLFMRPGSVFIQIVPLGTDWAAEAYYGEPAMKLGLNYMRYALLPKESSLYLEYNKDDPVLRDPESVNAKGWEVTKAVYLDGQHVRLNLPRFGKRLAKAYGYLISEKSKQKLKKGR